MPDSILRDLNREQSKIQATIANFNHHYGDLEGYVRQYVEQTTIEWAKLVLDHPKSLLLIVETSLTDGGDNEPIRFTGLPLAGDEIWDQLIHPTLSKDVYWTEHHGLTMSDMENQPSIAEAWSDIEKVLADRHIIIFGADYARNTLRTMCRTRLLDDAYCLHNKAKEYYGEFYELSLRTVMSYQGIDKKREDLKDSRERVLVLAQVVRNLSTGMKKQVQESEEHDDSLDEHPF